MSKPKPNHRYEIRISAGTNDIEGIRHILGQIMFELGDYEGGPARSLTGGPIGAWQVDVDEDKTVTHESYHATLQEYLRQRDEGDGNATNNQ